jgi:hypothetical protein
VSVFQLHPSSCMVFYTPLNLVVGYLPSEVLCGHKVWMVASLIMLRTHLQTLSELLQLVNWR